MINELPIKSIDHGHKKGIAYTTEDNYVIFVKPIEKIGQFHFEIDGLGIWFIAESTDMGFLIVSKILDGIV